MKSNETKMTDQRNEHLPEWVSALAGNEATRKESWPPRDPTRDFDWDHPTHEVYFDPVSTDFTPDFEQARKKLDYTYHRKPVRPRQKFQDVILTRVVDAAMSSSNSGSTSTSSSTSSEEEKQDTEVSPSRRPWIVFSAGTMAVGKGYVMSTLNERGLFPLNELLHIDPDMIKSELPEMSGYLQIDPVNAASKVHRESTQMADILLEHALQLRLPTLVDGSLKDVQYYKSLMARIRHDFPEYQLAILHVTASPDIIRARAQSRAENTGRAIPEDLLEESIAQVPKSVDALSPFVDVAFSISNEDDQPIELIRKRCDGCRDKVDIKKEDDSNDNDDNNNNQLSWKHFRETWHTNIDQCEKERQKMMQHLPSWCESQVPGNSHMSTCWMDPTSIDSAKKAYQKAYPNSCPTCKIGGDTQCGICLHDTHWCQCLECGPMSNPIIREKLCKIMKC